MKYEIRHDGPGLDSECRYLIYKNTQLAKSLDYAARLLSDIIGEDSQEVESLLAAIEFFGTDK